MRLRSFAAFALAALAVIVACSSAPAPPSGRVLLAARPHAPTLPCTAGVSALGLDAERDATLYVPAAVASSKAPAPLLVFLHGAGGRVTRAGVDRLRTLADERGVVLLVPRSRGVTWDAIHGSLGPDVTFVDRALAAAFDRCAVDPSRLGVAGFSDGASYALTLGLANGDLFTHVVAFSPCLISNDISPRGKPRFFVSHGKADDVLLVDVCGRPLAKRLKKMGYDVTYEEFDGRHEMTPALVEKAFDLFVPKAS